MVTKKPTSIIRTDPWSLNPTASQRVLLSQTVEVYRRVCRHLMGILLTHWSSLGGLSSQKRVLAVEKLIHQTAKNPNPKYRQFDQTFYKFPSRGEKFFAPTTDGPRLFSPLAKSVAIAAAKAVRT